MKFKKWLVLYLSATILSGWCPSARGLDFAAQPPDAELSTARIFDEPLVPLNSEANAAENQALAAALASYSQRATADDCSSLADFADNFPQSRWTASLLLHLGVEYYNYGYFSKALDAWQRSWKLFQNSDYAPAKPQADRALGELARMLARIGRATELSTLLESAKGRDLGGPAVQLAQATKEALWIMQNKPDYAFGCGPSALDRILLHFAPSKAGSSALLECKSGTNGFSLSQVADISQKLEMNYQMAYRQPGAPLIVPSVVHWKIEHYAALIERRGDRVLVQDYTFSASLWLSERALDEESSGYFLVPPGKLPDGWRPVSNAEGQSVWGRGQTVGRAPKSNVPCKDKSCGGASCQKCAASSGGMTTYSFHALLTSLSLQDTPLTFDSPVGPQVFFTANYNQTEADQPANFYYSNLGPLWDCSWLSYVTDNPTSPSSDVSIYMDGGGEFDFSNFNPTNQTFALEPMSQTLLVRLTTNSYEMQFPDGARREYSQSDGATGSTRRILLTQVIDPYGNSAHLQYDGQLRFTNVVNATGQGMAVAYTNTAFPYLITSVTDPFGRSAQLLYDTNGRLVQITDTLGLVSRYTYGAGQFVTNLTTPYGVTTFTTGTTNGGTYLTATDPLGGTEAMEYSQSLPVTDSLPAAQVPHGISTFNLFLSARDSFYWDKKAFAEGAWDWSKAHIYHWLHQSPNGEMSSRILESEKDPLESRIWYNYPGEYTNLGAPYYLDAAYSGASDTPSIVARVLDDGSTQINSFGYNAFGNLTNWTDPLGRSFTRIYASNNIDALELRMTHQVKNELVSSATYNAQHQPLTLTDAAGQTTTFTYNSQGQLLTVTDPKGESLAYTYDASGRVLSVHGPLAGTNDVTACTYDALNRVLTTTDPEGYTITYAYDAADRPILRTYPDGTTEQMVYDRLDLAAFKDRMGRWTTNTYNALRQPVSIRDPLGQTTQYEWCKCGLLVGMTDPMGRTTSWDYDLESRPISKRYPDGSGDGYTYENSTSRLRMREDAGGQQVWIEHNADNSLKSFAFLNATNPTAGVSYSYDPDYPRLTTMQDGVGVTTYSYYPIAPVPGLGAGKIETVSGPTPNTTVNYQYDELGRVLVRAINGAAQTTVYDGNNRPASVTNALGVFQYSYGDSSARPSAVSCPNGQTTLFSYYGNLGDGRLSQAVNLKPGGALLSSFGYAYDASGSVTAWTNQWDTQPMRVWQLGGDADQQLSQAVRTDGSSPLSTNSYVYDAAGNRTLDMGGLATNRYSYNALNELVGDDNGPAAAVTYEWDAAHRLTAINQGGGRTEFTYDGWGRRARIVEKTNNLVTANNYFVWCGYELCEERDATGSNVVRRFFPQGEVIVGSGGTTNLYYTRDHLGSVREALDAAGTLQARYDYDPYGRQTVLTANIEPAFAYTGHFMHKPSGLYLAAARALNPQSGRWLSRDPAGEDASPNLYDYVGNDPVDAFDPYGLFLAGVTGTAEAEAGAGVGLGGQASVGYGVATENSFLPVLGAIGIVGQMLNPTTWPLAIGTIVTDRIVAKAKGTKPVFGLGGFLTTGNTTTLLPCKSLWGLPSKGAAVANSPGTIAGASAGLGGGVFFSNATHFDQIGGPFLTWNLNTPLFGASLGVDPNSGVWIFSLTGSPPGASYGLSSSIYVTDTVSGQF